MESVLFDDNDRDVLEYNYKTEASSTQKHLMFIAGYYGISSIAAGFILSGQGGLGWEVIVGLALFVLIQVAFVMIARSAPMVAAVGSIVVFILIEALAIWQSGATALLKGWLLKAIVIYLLIKAYTHARDALKFKSELQIFQR